MYCDTCINRSCSKAETLFRRTDTLDLICFLYASLSHISKAETVKRALLQTDNFFSVIRLKNNLLYPDTKKNFRNSEKQRIKLNIFVNFLKKKHFFTLQSNIFFNFNLKFWRSATLLTRTRYLLFQVALCNQPTIVFAPLKAISTFKPYCTPLWTIGFSTVTYIKLWWSVKDLQKNALKI